MSSYRNHFVDLGLQAVHVTNQDIIFSKNQEARNRVNAIYKVGFFLGGVFGTTLGLLMWEYFGWTGVSVLGIVFQLGIAV